MGLLSKLFGEAGKEFAQEVKKTVDYAVSEAKKREDYGAQNVAQNVAHEVSASGDSWGEEMPAEENQFNYPGSYKAYFSGIYHSEFSDYQITEEDVRNNKATVFTFSKDGRKVLVVEVRSDRSNARKLCDDCRREGVRYIRFYYDHEGWWNTRSYVIRRTRENL